jgi:Protein of unknown function (DUF3617)
MIRERAAFGFGLAVLLALPADLSRADDLPIRKAGLWEIKMLRIGSPTPDLAMQHCTDATVDKEMNNLVSPMANQICSRQDIQKTSTGYVADSVCSVGGISVSSHSEISGDFNSAYTVATTSHSDLGAKAAPRDTVIKIEAKWLGACKPEQKAGDVVMPGGFKLNVKDAAKFQLKLPGAKQ